MVSRRIYRSRKLERCRRHIFLYLPNLRSLNIRQENIYNGSKILLRKETYEGNCTVEARNTALFRTIQKIKSVIF